MASPDRVDDGLGGVEEEQARALEPERAALEAEQASREQDREQRVKAHDKMRQRYIEKPSDATE